MESRRNVVLVTIVFLVASAAGFEGECTYTSEACSCKFGSETEGTCWDPIVGAPGKCRSRSCRAGWTCSCGGRTHLCRRQVRTAHLVAPADKGSGEAACEVKSMSGVGKRDISLGSIDMHLSRKGAGANDCLQVAFWHNGELQENFGDVPDVDSGTVGGELDARQNHNLLELRGGDVVAWRFKAGSYYCQMHWMDLIVNGTSLNWESEAIDVRYARKYTPDWFRPEFVPVLGGGEDASLQAFIPPRLEMFSGEVILPNVDYWQSPQPSSPDHKTSNWYWRLSIAPSVTD